MKSHIRILAILALGLVMSPWAQAAPSDRTLQVAPTQGNRVALVIGNSTYANSPLVNPVNDARAISAKLKTLGFEVVVRENLTTKQIGGALREFRALLKPGAEALFFYAGHGLQIKGVNYLPAVDADIFAEEDVPNQSINTNQVLEIMEDAKTRLNLVFLDACRNNPYARKFRSAETGLAKLNAPSGTLISFATRPGSVASDGTGKNGLYTTHLLAEMNKPNVPIEKVLKDVVSGVKKASKGQQEPWMEGSIEGDFYFIFQGSTTVNVQQAPSDPETEAWQAAESVNSVAGYEAYLRDYPKGKYVSAARIKLEALRKPGKPSPAPAVATSTDPETAFWNEVKQSGTREYLDAYLKQYPKGKYTALAKVELKKLDDQERQQKDQAEQQAWESAKAEHTPQAYDAYLAQHPKGRYAALASAAKVKAQRDLEDKDKQEALRRQREEMEAARKAEDDLWHKAKTAEDSPTVQAYLDRYPSGRYAAEARTKLEAVKKAEAEMKPGKVFKDCADCPEMVVIPAGSFDMGSNGIIGDNSFGSEERNMFNKWYKPVHRVTFSKPFAMGKTEVTQGQWRALMGNNPSHFSACGDDCPVEKVNWNDAQAFVRKLSQKTGKTYRLPSEAEWEYTCKAGNNYSYCGSDNVASVAWHILNSGSKTHPVGGRQANAWGVHDMSGNVWEWLEDCWNDSYHGAPIDGSAWASSNCSTRAMRGGAWGSTYLNNLSFFRSRYSASDMGYGIGFRLARMLP